MRYLLDTNICIYILKQKPASVIHQFNSLSSEDLGISTITLAELSFGASKSNAYQKNMTALKALLASLQVIPFGHEAAIIYGGIKAKLQKQGTPIGPLDTLIAAHCLSLGYTLITNNTKEFTRVEGLAVENWVD